MLVISQVIIPQSHGVFFLAYLYSAGTQNGNLHPAGWPILFCGPTQEPCVSHSQHREKSGEVLEKNASEWTGSVEINKKEIPGSKRNFCSHTNGYRLSSSNNSVSEGCVWIAETVAQIYTHMGRWNSPRLLSKAKHQCWAVLERVIEKTRCIVSLQSVQTIHLLKVSCIQFHTNGCVIHIANKLKHTRPGYHQKPLELPYFQADEKLCVVKCLKGYIERTKDLRQNCDQLLLCHARPHGPASKYTVSRWLRDVLSDDEICDFTPHSFRGASASAMLNSGATLDDILKSAGWTNASTFYKFYNRSVKKEANK